MTDKKDDISLSIRETLHPEIKQIDGVVLPEYKAEKKNMKTNWTKEIEEYVYQICKLSDENKSLHFSKSKKYMFKYNLFIYISIFLGPLVGMLSAININLNDTKVIPLIILCISFMNGLMMSVLKFRRWDEGALAHKSSSAKYSALSTNAKRQLTLSAKDREDADDYLKWLIDVLNILFLSSPMLSEEAKNKFENINFIKKHEQSPPTLPQEIPQTEKSKHIVKDGRLEYELNRILNA